MTGSKCNGIIIVFFMLFLFSGTASADEADDAYPKGLLDPTPEEIEWMKANRTELKGVKPNALGLKRINKAVLESGSTVVYKTGDEIDDIAGALPAYVDNSKLQWFPLVRSQGSLNSCVSFNAAYYILGYSAAKTYGWDNKNNDNTIKFSPKFVYNMMNGGSNVGTSFTGNMSFLEKHGACTWDEFPYDKNYREWCPDTAAWRGALKYRLKPYSYINGFSFPSTNLDDLKASLNNGNIHMVTVWISSWQYKNISNDPSTTADDAFVGKPACYWVNGYDGSHAMTCVGYNDDIWVDVNSNGSVDSGEKGALRIANSWGTGWKDGGFVWVAYDALNSTSIVSGAPSSGRTYALRQALTSDVTLDYEPKAIAQFTLNHKKRNQLNMKLGISKTTDSEPTTFWYPYALTYDGGAYAFDGTTTACDMTFAFDFTDILPPAGQNKRWYVGMYDSASGDIAQIKDFTLINVSSGRDVICSNTPKTVDAGQEYVWVEYAYQDESNSAPSISTVADVSTNEDTSTGPLGFTVSDGATSAGCLEVSAASSNTNLVPVTNISLEGSDGSRTVAVNPAADKNGSAVITLTVTDLGGLTASTSFTVTVNPVNDAPIADGKTVGTPEDTPVLVIFTGADIDGDSLSFSVSADPSNGTLSGTPPNITYTPDAGFTGADSFSYRAFDGALYSSAATVTVNVYDVPDTLVCENGVVTGVDNAGWTTVNLSNTYISPVVVCSPNYDNSSVPLVVRIQNAGGGSFDVMLDRADGQTGTVSGIPVHYLVVEEGIYTDGLHGVKMEAVTYSSSVTDNKSSWNGESRTYAQTYADPIVLGQVMTYNDTGWSVFWCCGSSAGNPPTGSDLKTGKHVGADSDKTRSDETVGYIVIESGNGNLGSVPYVADLGADTVKGFDDSVPYTYSLSGLSNPTGAVVTQAAMDGTDGSWAVLYGVSPVTAGQLALGADEDQMDDTERAHADEQIGYIVFDSTGSNSAPNAVNDTASTNEDTAKTINVLANDTDADGDSLSVASVTQPSDGTVVNNTSDVTYTPDGGFTGTDTFTYTVSDGNGGTDTATVTVTVNAVNSAPNAVNDTASTNEDTAKTINVLANDTDADGDSLSVASVTQPSDGTVVNNTSNVTYTPDADFTGTDTFTYTVLDGNGGTDTATVTVTVNAVNSAPNAVNDTASTNEDTAKTINVLANDTDADGDSLSVASVTQPSDGTVVNNTSNVTYTPDAGFTGTDTFTYTVSDGNGGTDTATVTVTVHSVNTAPVAGDQSVEADTAVLVDIYLSGFDGDGDPLTYEIVDYPLHGNLSSDDGDEIVSYVSDPGYKGSDSFTFRVFDGSEYSPVATVSLEIGSFLVRINSVSTGAAYSLAIAEVGELYFIDRFYAIETISSDLEGNILVRTSNNDKRIKAETHLVLELGEEAVVSVCYDPRASILPAWLDDGSWTLTGSEMGLSAKPDTMDVYEKVCPAGELVLGGNLAEPASGAKLNYFLVIRPLSGSTDYNYTEGPIAPREWFNEGDSDGDGLLDDFESWYGLDSGNIDSDGDGISDEDEIMTGDKSYWDGQYNSAIDDVSAGCSFGSSSSSVSGMFLMILFACAVLLVSKKKYHV